MNIKNNYEAVGVGLESFEREISKLVNSTTSVEVATSDITLFTYTGTDENGIMFFKSMADNTVRKASEEAFGKKFPAEVMEELKNETKVLITFKNAEGKESTTLVSRSAICMMAARCGLMGDALVAPSQRRDAFLMECVRKLKKEALTFIIRNGDEGGRKVFAVHSKSYPYVKQTALLKIIQNFESEGSLKTPHVGEWNVNHSMTSCKVYFPEMEEDFMSYYKLPSRIAPCVILESSDVGDCSVTAKGAWKIGGSIVIQSDVKKVHKGNLTVTKVIEDIDNNIFRNYRKLPERLAELLMIDITDVSSAIDSAFDELKMQDIICERNNKKLASFLDAECSMALTAYDLAIAIMEMPGRIEGISTYARNSLEKKVIEAPFINWEKIAKASGIYLTA